MSTRRWAPATGGGAGRSRPRRPGIPVAAEVAFAAGLAFLTATVYARVGGFDFLHYDDPGYVTQNAHVRAGLSGAGVWWALTASVAANWHPLTWLSHMLDWQLFGERAGGHHLVSVALHVVTVVLLFAAFRAMTGALWRPAFVAAMFALHPLHVESVAWVAERKDVLCGLFWATTLLAYNAYVRRPRAARYGVVIASLALALLSKPMAVTLPVLLLLLDVWPFARWKSMRDPSSQAGAAIPSVGTGRILLEKAPMLALSLGSSVMTVIAQKAGGAVISTAAIPLPWRIVNALCATATYVWKTVWPANLALFYPWHTPAAIEIAAASVVLAAVSWLALRLRRRNPAVAIGWLWFLITLLPVIGLVQVGGQALADRYTYVPQIGLSIMAAWGLAAIPILARQPAVAVAAFVVPIALWCALTWRQVGYWKDGMTLFQHSLDVTGENYVALTQLGIEWHIKGDAQHALELYDRAVKVKPSYSLAQGNLGLCLAQLGRTEEGVPHLLEAIRLKPDFAEAHRSLGVARAEEGRFEEAENEIREALRLNPDDAIAHCYLGDVLARRGAPADARAEYQIALRLRPGYPRAEAGLGRLGSAPTN